MPDHKPSIEHYRRLNPHTQEVVKKEIIKWLAFGVMYLLQIVVWYALFSMKKKGGMTIVLNERNEHVAVRSITGWRVCMDYQKLNA